MSLIVPLAWLSGLALRFSFSFVLWLSGLASIVPLAWLSGLASGLAS